MQCACIVAQVPRPPAALHTFSSPPTCDATSPTGGGSGGKSALALQDWISHSGLKSPGLDFTSNPVLRSRSEFASNPVLGPGLDSTSNPVLRSRSEFASNPVLRSRSGFDVESSPEIQGRAESDFGGKPRSRTGVESGSQVQV